VTVASSSRVSVQLSPIAAQGPRHPLSRQWDSGVNGFDVLKSSWSLRPAGRSAVQVSGQLREVPCAETVVNPEPSNGSPAISSATVIRRVPEVAAGTSGDGSLAGPRAPVGGREPLRRLRARGRLLWRAATAEDRQERHRATEQPPETSPYAHLQLPPRQRLGTLNSWGKRA